MIWSIALLSCLTLTAAHAPPKKLALPGYIAPSLRTLLDKRMARHSESAMHLTMGVVLLAYDDVGEVATQMAEEPGLARPREGEMDTVNVALPPMFFVFQDQLRARARELAKVAADRDNAKLSKAFARLTATCMACHSAYLNGPGSHEDWWPTDTAQEGQPRVKTP